MEGVVAPDVDPEQREGEYYELGDPVRPVDGGEEKAAGVEDDALEIKLNERARRR
jgi:hypothetical protein